jgi:hypothetical protein
MWGFERSNFSFAIIAPHARPSGRATIGVDTRRVLLNKQA